MSRISVDGVTYSHHDIRRMRDRGTYEEGAAVAFGLMGMAEAIRAISQTERCHECGYDQQVPHPNADYSGDLYPCTDGYIYCGWCADRLEKRDAGEAFPGPPWRLAPPSRGTAKEEE